MTNDFSYKISNFDEENKTIELMYYSDQFLRKPEDYEPCLLKVDDLKKDVDVDSQLSKIAKSLVLSELEKEKIVREIIEYFEKLVGNYIPYYFVKNGEDDVDFKTREPEVKLKVLSVKKSELVVCIEPYCSLFKKPEGDYGYQEIHIDGILSSNEEAIKTFLFKCFEEPIIKIIESEKNEGVDEQPNQIEPIDNENIIESISDVEKSSSEEDVLEIEDINDGILNFIKNNVGLEKNSNKESFEFLN